ncbi:MAG: DUF2851 family protein [Bacteroidales bacterium]|nr:DUF2851 family protein [Bacteroidales bacterium]
MTEEFLHYLWKYKLIKQPLILSAGEQCQVINTGNHNTHAGPDFLNAHLRIDETLWVGNVEIHIQASDWYKHNHQKDSAYENVILHIVYKEDKSVRLKNGAIVPTLELAGKFDENLLSTYEDLMNNLRWIPCEQMISGVNRFTVNNWLDRVLIERLENKSIRIGELLEHNLGDWAETFYQTLARNFGFKVNAIPFELLARSVPLKILAKHKHDRKQVEALLFGQAGLLKGGHRDGYFREMKKEYSFLAGKYGLEPIDPHLWRFLRMRPSNFPTIRLSQLSGLICKSSHLFSEILETGSVDSLLHKFEVQASSYWNTHYTFGKTSAKREKLLGKAARQLLLINTIIPFLFLYGRTKGIQPLIDRSLKFLDQIPGERNHVTRKWESLGLSCRTSFSTQALLQLKSEYCDSKKCLHCSIGHAILTQKHE